MDPESPASEEASPALPVPDITADLSAQLPAALPPPPSALDRAVALFEVVLCSDFPTQLLLLQLFTMLGFVPRNADDTLNLPFVVALSLADTLLLIGLIVVLVRLRGDRPRDLFLGHRPIWPEVRLGVPMTLLALVIAVVVMGVIQVVAPSLHTVPRNPLQDLVSSPGDALVFAGVVVIAGGVREELQRAFLMNRFERWLGGPLVGIVVASLVFGLGHALQGFDAVIATALLGAFWAVVYLRRRSVVAPVVSHSCFNLLQLVQLLVLGR
jgi:membrane protease YdiL (CAAX protease family)